MNAVKRCLALFAATLVVGACGGDPTAGDAGTDLSIRATPGAVWVRNNSSASIIIEAVDKLGGAQPGSWTAGTPTGPYTVTFDSTYQGMYNPEDTVPIITGSLAIRAKFIITPTSEGEGTVVITGTGGTITVPIRIAPDTLDFGVMASDSTPTLFQPITLTAPTGIVFTGGTTVRFFNGPQARDTSNGGISFSSITNLSADSSQITFVMGPGANGTMRLTGLASRSTPGLTTTARAPFALTAVATVDTNSFSVTPTFRFSAVGTPRVTTSVFDTLVLTAPANYRFVPGTKVEFFRIVSGAYTLNNGASNPKVLGINADSSQLRVLVAVGARGRLKVNPVVFQVAPGVRFFVRAPAAETFDLRTSIDTSNFAVTFNKTSPVAEGDTVTATAPANLRFFATTVSIHATSSGTFSGGDSARVTGYNTDSTQVKFLLPPGASGKVRFSLMGLKNDPEMRWQGRSAGTISAAAAPAVVATLSPATANMNDTVTVALDPSGPYRFRPTSTAELGGLPAVFARVSLDSLSLKVLPTPGTVGALTLTNIRYAALPSFQVKANTASSLTVNAATSLGPDLHSDVANPTFAAPTATGTSNAKGWWDALTVTEGDPSPDCDGGAAAQFYTLTVATAGSYTINVNWKTAAASDIDFGVMVKDGGYDGGGSCSDYLSTAGLSGAKPELNTALTLAAGTYVIAIIDYLGTTAAGDAVSVNVRRN